VVTAEKVSALYQEQYFDLNVRHFHEKLRQGHAIEISYSWVKHSLQSAGLLRRQKHPQAAPATAREAAVSGYAAAHLRQPASLVQRRPVVRPDCHSGRCKQLRFTTQRVEEESMRTVMLALRGVIETPGLFCALCRSSQPFFITPKAGEAVDITARRRPAGR
jgi:hypothetical protein